MDSNNPFYNQVALLVRLLPIIGKQSCFALKGGTAINLFLRDLPRLSVDIDLAYLPSGDRNQALAEIDQALNAIAKEALAVSPVVNVTARPNKQTNSLLKLNMMAADVMVKVEVTPVLRGSVYEPEIRAVKPKVEKEFGYVEVPVLSFYDLYAGKLCATLDRQHPRDLYDTKLLLDTEGINRELMVAFMVYLMGHNRPMAELLAPNPKPLADSYRAEFAGMAFQEMKLELLEATLPRLVKSLHENLTEDDKAFLLGFKSGNPEWDHLGLAHIEQLPAIRWKQLNLNNMDKKKRQQAIGNLEAVLHGVSNV
ncbi:MAG: nucleotidyl transferase AbiEii/AbiGii toxin family protein [Pseudomonadales bacterium]|nr:nucleotidyl transferase AbiEii/AbiGii toxin family protein [Pseudomonadales bacterium]